MWWKRELSLLPLFFSEEGLTPLLESSLSLPLMPSPSWELGGEIREKAGVRHAEIAALTTGSNCLQGWFSADSPTF